MERKWEGKMETEQLDTHRSDTGSHLAPSSNFHMICGMGLREKKRGWEKNKEIIWGKEISLEIIL